MSEPAPLTTADVEMPPLHDLEDFEIGRVDRRWVKNAPYNPRKIDDYARKALTAFLKKEKLREPLVWNRRSGNLVSGHQRISIIDDVMGTDVYSMTMSIIDVDDAQERRLNGGFNNPEMQGSFDAEKIRQMILDPIVPVAPQDMGFTRMGMEFLGFDDEFLAPLFATAKQPKKVQDDAAKIQAIKDRKKEAKGDSRAADPTQFYTSVVFKDDAACAEFLAMIDVPASEAYVKGEHLRAIIVTLRERVATLDIERAQAVADAAELRRQLAELARDTLAPDAPTE